MFGAETAAAVVPAEQGSCDPRELEVLYDLVASSTLPVIDISRSVRSVLFSRPTVQKLNRAIARTRRALFVISNAAIALAAVTLLGSARVGRWLAPPTMVMALPATLIQVLMMRFEIVLLLLRTYDFWFFTLIWTSSMVALSLCLADTRALVVFIVWLSMQANIMIDANTSYRESIYFAGLGLVFSVVVILAIAFDMVEELHNFCVLTLNGYALTAHTVIVNGWATCSLVLVRNLYRRRAAVRDHGANKTVVQCLSFRCRVRLRGRSRRRRDGSSLLSTVTSVSSGHMTRPTASYFHNAQMVQMRCMRSRIKFSPRNVVAPFARRLYEIADNERRIVALRVFFISLMGIGVCFTAASFFPAAPHACAGIALVTTSLFCVSSLALYHRQLLQYLVLSFDFAFLSAQLTIASVALCDLYRWDSRRLALTACWLWAHWVLTFDCMPPVIKTKLRLRNRLALIVAVSLALAHVALVYQLASSEHTALFDRAIVDYKWSRFHVHTTVLPLLASRMLMTFGWCCRLGWRLWDRHDNELIVVLGTVTYINNRRKITILQAKLRDEQARSVVRQFARHVTRRLSAFGAAVVPAVSATEAFSTPETLCVAPTMNARLTNIASQILDATRAVPQLQQQMSLNGGSRPGLSVFDASGPMLFEAAAPPRTSSAEQAKLSSINTRLTSMESSLRGRTVELKQLHCETTPIENAGHLNSESESTEEPVQPRFQV